MPRPFRKGPHDRTPHKTLVQRLKTCGFLRCALRADSSNGAMKGQQGQRWKVAGVDKRMGKQETRRKRARIAAKWNERVNALVIVMALVALIGWTALALQQA